MDDLLLWRREFTGQGDSLLWSVTGQDDLKGVSALQL